MLVDLELGLLREEAINRGGVELEDLGLDVRGGCAERRAELAHLLLHRLVLGDARVFVRLHAGVGIRSVEVLLQVGDEVERTQHLLRALAERAAELLALRNGGSKFFFRRAPGGVRWVEFGEVPLVLIGNFRAVALLLRRGADERSREQGEGRDFHELHVLSSRLLVLSSL